MRDHHLHLARRQQTVVALRLGLGDAAGVFDGHVQALHQLLDGLGVLLRRQRRQQVLQRELEQPLHLHTLPVRGRALARAAQQLREAEQRCVSDLREDALRRGRGHDADALGDVRLQQRAQLHRQPRQRLHRHPLLLAVGREDAQNALVRLDRLRALARRQHVQRRQRVVVPLHLPRALLRQLDNMRHRGRQVGLELAAQAGGQAAPHLQRVQPQPVARGCLRRRHLQRDRHHLRHVRAKHLRAHRLAHQRDALQHAAAERAQLRRRARDQVVLQHRHHCPIIAREPCRGHVRHRRDGRHDLFKHGDVRRAQQPHERAQHRLRVRLQRLRRAAVDEVGERRHRVRLHPLPHRLAHRRQQRGHHLAVQLRLQVRTHARGQVAQQVQRRVAHARVRVAQQRQRPGHHQLPLLRVVGQHVAHRADGHHGRAPMLPHGRPQQLTHRLEHHRHHLVGADGLCDAPKRVERHVRQLVAVLRVHVRLVRPLRVLLHLQHHVQQALHRLADELVVHHGAAHLGVPFRNGRDQLDAHAPHVLVQPLGRHHLHRGRHQRAQEGREEAGAAVRHVRDRLQARDGVGALAGIEAVADHLQHLRHQRLQRRHLLLLLHHAHQVGQRLQRLRAHASLVLRVPHRARQHARHALQHVRPALGHVVGQQREDAQRSATQRGLGRSDRLLQEGEQLRPQAVV
mmetsp:Transcript_13642/g.43582  ORF Transcript_13642/g.43582 Transcript_13642/m.43582 type:complete len:685 (+) Transcript_13642:950-3004(+)